MVNWAIYERKPGDVVERCTNLWTISGNELFFVVSTGHPNPVVLCSKPGHSIDISVSHTCTVIAAHR